MKYNIKSLLLAVTVTLASCPMMASRDLPVTSVGGRECYIYDVKKGENIYDVSHELGLPTVEITRYNPSAADGLRAGMRLYIPTSLLSDSKATSSTAPAAVVPAARPEAQVADNPVPGTATYTVKRGESLYGISRRFDISMEQLIALNPSAEYGVKAGDVLIINPDAAPAQTAMADVPEATDDYSLIPSEQRITDRYVVRINPPATDSDSDTETPAAVGPVTEDLLADMTVDRDTVGMAVILPFMLNQGEQSKQAQLFTEFYKGLVLAADSLRSRDGGHHVTIYAFDSASSADTIAAIMRRPEMDRVNLIIGPDNDAHLQLIADALRPGTRLYNTFNVRSTLSTGRPEVIQANIPHSPMLEKAVDAFIDMYGGCTPVFLARIDGAADKDAFTSLLKQRLDTDSRTYVDLTFRNLMTQKDLENLSPDSSYVFVPVSGSRAEFAKFSEAIRKFGDSRPQVSTRLFGYPDWIIFRGEYLTRLCELEATIYTRFYTDTTSPAVRDFNTLFKTTYGTDMMDAAPVQGQLGFDTGMYLLTLMQDYGSEFSEHFTPYTGLQSVMNFTTRPGDGPVNDALLIVTFTPSGNAIKTTLE